MTSSGLEYFVDVMLELSVRLDGFEQVRVARVVKSNSPDFPVGLEIENPAFKDLLDRLGEGPKPKDEVPEHLAVVDAAPEAPAGPSLDDLVAQAEAYGLARADLLLAARHYCGVEALDRLSPEQITDLLARMEARYAKATAAPAPAKRRNGKAAA